jgi:hypothetical protein
LYRAIRARYISSNSLLDSCPSRMALANAIAELNATSVISAPFYLSLLGLKIGVP